MTSLNLLRRDVKLIVMNEESGAASNIIAEAVDRGVNYFGPQILQILMANGRTSEMAVPDFLLASGQSCLHHSDETAINCF
jgi:hypothetical protein